VIGRSGVIEWIGRPSDLDPIVASVLDGTHDREKDAKKFLQRQRASR